MEFTIWTSLVFNAVFLTATDADRFLMLPLSFPSHILYYSKIAEALIQKGHHVDFVISPGTKLSGGKPVNSDAFHVVTYHLKEADNYLAPPGEAGKVWLNMLGTQGADSVVGNRWYQTYAMSFCRNVLSDQQFFHDLQKKRYKLAITDATPFSRCHYVLLYRLGLEYISMTTQYDPWFMGIPAIPSFMPFPMATSYSEKMTFWERFYNMYRMLDWAIWPRIENTEDKLVSTYAPDKELVTINYLAKKSLLWFVNTDNALDYARPTMPNIIYIGGLTTGPGKPLPTQMQIFMDEAEHGVILVSFGSWTQGVPDKLLQTLLQTLIQIKQRVIWKYDSSLLKEVPENVMCVPWIPQGDILAHPKTRLFISHGGNNGQFEALYHMVPMITTPLFSDQFYNARRFEYKGYGTFIWLSDFTPERLIQDINNILGDTSFQERLQRGKEIFVSAPMKPLDRVMYWIEHVLEFGADHLRSHSLDMPWYQYWMVDILVFFTMILAILLLMILFFLRLLRRVCCRSEAKVKLH